MKGYIILCKVGDDMQIKVRTWQEEDALALYQMSMHPYYLRKRIWRYLYPDTFLHAMSTIQFYQCADPTRFLFRALECDGVVCGFLECEKKSSECGELSYWLDVNYWNQGIMQEGVRQLCIEAFKCLSILCIFARVDKKNEPSSQVLIHNGFQRESLEDYYIFRKYK